MIDIASLTKADKAREVRYATFGSVEFGHITSWNQKFIFVRYHLRRDAAGDTPRYGSTSEATRPEDLEFIS